jgi:hypothetical protein
MSSVNLSKLILYRREINRTVFCESESKLILYRREINRTVFCEFSESIGVDTVQKRDK